MKKTKNKFSKLYTPIAVIIIALLVITYVIPWASSGQFGKATASISMSFEGVGSGKDPQGGRFDINEIKNDKVLADAILASGIKNLEVSDLKKRITINPNAGKNTLKELLTLELIEGKTQDVKERMIYPTSFTIGLKDMGLPSYFTDKKLLGNILISYNNFIEARYLVNTEAEPAYTKAEILAMDYPEMMKVLGQEVDSLLRYIGSYKASQPQYISKATGISFTDIYQQAQLLKDADIGNMRSIVNHYLLSKNAVNRIKYEETLLKRAIVVANKLKGADLATSDIIKVYENKSNFIFPSADTGAVNLSPLENQFYSDLIRSLVADKTSYIDAKYNEQDILRAIEKLQNSVITSAEYEKNTTEINLGTAKALARIDVLREQTKAMAKEYYELNISSKIKTSDVSYKVNSYGNLLLNLIILIIISILILLGYQWIKRKGYQVYLIEARNYAVATFNKPYFKKFIKRQK